MPVRSAASSGRWPGRTPNSPVTLGAVTSLTCARRATPVGVTISSWIVSAMARSRRLPRGPGLHLVDAPRHVEVLLGDVIELAFEDLLEARDRVLERDE